MIAVFGRSPRAAVFATYAFSESVLNVLPLWFFAEAQPAYRGDITVPTNFARFYSPSGFVHRCVFLNDEDLLSGFARDPAGSSMFSLEMYDRVLQVISS